jgi:membrane associated rhomboid family serine protease
MFFFLVPIGHDELTLRGLPYATLGLIAACFVVFALTVGAAADEEERVAAKTEVVLRVYADHGYVELPADVVESMDRGGRALYRARRSWIAELAESPDTAIDPSIEEALDSPTGGMMRAQGQAGQESIAKAARLGAKVDARIEIVAKSVFLVGYRDLPEGEMGEVQARLDEAVADLAAARADSLVRRFGYVPSEPGIGLVSSIFLHAGFLHLIGNMVFLWIAAVKLEQLWSKPVFIAAFVVLGVIAALAHGLTTSEPSIPVVGASGAIAGMMGAMLVRLPKDKIHFAYFFLIMLRPRWGTFQAPAFVMLPLWLATQIGSALIGGPDGTAYASHIGGFAAGCALALAMKKLRFEQRVLKQVEEEKPVDPEDLPLVAFQRPVQPAGAAAAPGGRLPAIAATLVGFDRSALRFALPPGGTVDVPTSRIPIWAAGSLTRSEAADTALLGGVSLRAPAVVLAFVEAAAPSPRVIVVDAAHLTYAGLLDGAATSPREAFFRLVARLNAALPGAAFAGDRARIHGGALPEFASLAPFLVRLEEAPAVRGLLRLSR